jgi:hypothetical protein
MVIPWESCGNLAHIGSLAEAISLAKFFFEFLLVILRVGWLWSGQRASPIRLPHKVIL